MLQHLAMDFVCSEQLSQSLPVFLTLNSKQCKQPEMTVSNQQYDLMYYRRGASFYRRGASFYHRGASFYRRGASLNLRVIYW